MITAGPISRFSPFVGQRITIENYAVRPASEETFADEVFSLLRDATAERRHPTKVVELPRENRVLVAELNRVEPIEGFQVEVEAMAAALARQQASQALAQEWFDVESIRQRMNWRDK